MLHAYYFLNGICFRNNHSPSSDREKKSYFAVDISRISIVWFILFF
jgi:hypothetical protein